MVFAEAVPCPTLFTMDASIGISIRASLRREKHIEKRGKEMNSEFIVVILLIVYVCCEEEW